MNDNDENNYANEVLYFSYFRDTIDRISKALIDFTKKYHSIYRSIQDLVDDGILDRDGIRVVSGWNT